jgi:predicted nucleotidyltransferase
LVFTGTALRVSNDFETLLVAMRKAAGALRDAEIPFALAGSVAVYAYGGPDTDHDVDFLVKPEDADRALAVLSEAGFSVHKPAEGWLYKAVDAEGALIDMIFQPATGPVTDELLARAEVVEVYAIHVPVLPPTDVLASKLLALREHNLDFAPMLEIARSLREQIDWDELRRRTDESPYAKPFFTLVEELGLAA